MSELAFTLPAEALDAIVERAAELVLEQLDTRQSRWLTRKEAAAYLSVPVSRLEKDRRIPWHRWDGRVLYHRDELDAFVRSFDNGRS